MEQQRPNPINPLVSTAKFGLAVSSGVFLVVALTVILLLAFAGWQVMTELARPILTTLTVTVLLALVIAAVLAVAYLGFKAAVGVKKSNAEADALLAVNEKTRAEAQKTRAEAGGVDAATQVLQATCIETRLAEIQRVLAESMAARTVTAPHDYQVHRLSDPDQLKNETSTPLHLQPDQANGVTGATDPLAERRWSAFQNSHARRAAVPDEVVAESAATRASRRQCTICRREARPATLSWVSMLTPMEPWPRCLRPSGTWYISPAAARPTAVNRTCCG